jgi:hypothetical protein
LPRGRETEWRKTISWNAYKIAIKLAWLGRVKAPDGDRKDRGGIQGAGHEADGAMMMRVN